MFILNQLNRKEVSGFISLDSQRLLDAL